MRVPKERWFISHAADDSAGGAGELDYLRAAHSGIRPWDGPAGELDYLRAAHSGIRPWDGPAGELDYLRAAHSGIRPWDGPAGSCASRDLGDGGAQVARELASEARLRPQRAGGHDHFQRNLRPE